MAAAAAGASRSRVLLVQPDPELLRAAELSLSSWGIEIAGSAADAPPTGSMPSIERAAATLAGDTRADAVTWISVADDGAVLWVYDAESHRIGSSVLARRPPFDEPSAAAVALSLKALLRTTAVAPEAERTPRPTTAAPAPVAAPAPQLRLEAQVGARVLPRELGEVRAGLGASYWPALLHEHLGFGLGITAGPGVRVQSEPLDAHFADLTASASVRSRIALPWTLGVEPGLGMSAHWAMLEPSSTLPDTRDRVTYVDPSVDASLGVSARIGAVDVGLKAAFEYLLTYQRYLLHDRPVLDPSPFLFEVSATVGLGVL